MSDTSFHSPAKSPITSPADGNTVTSAPARALNTHPRLESIAEDENAKPLSLKRDNAPQSIDLPSVPTITAEDVQNHGADDEETIISSLDELSVTVGDPVTDRPTPGFTPGVIHLENPHKPPATAAVLSPLPPANVKHAGHTPPRTLRGNFSPVISNMSDGASEVGETPTRANTHLNTFLTSRTAAESDDIPLKGPLNMPELPNALDETNFTIEALTARLAHIESHPEDSQPQVLQTPSPGVFRPGVDDKEEQPFFHDFAQIRHSGLSSQAMSSTITSPPVLGNQSSGTDEPGAKDLEHGGIKLRKKPSCNFGAPFGQLGSLGARKTSNP